MNRLIELIMSWSPEAKEAKRKEYLERKKVLTNGLREAADEIYKIPDGERCITKNQIVNFAVLFNRIAEYIDYLNEKIYRLEKDK